MKHSDMIAELLKKFNKIDGINGCDAPECPWCSKKKELLLTAFATIQERTEKETIDRVEKEVIGEDEPPSLWSKDDMAGYHSTTEINGRLNPDGSRTASLKDPYVVEALNGLRLQQRQSLNKMKGNV